MLWWRRRWETSCCGNGSGSREKRISISLETRIIATPPTSAASAATAAAGVTAGRGPEHSARDTARSRMMAIWRATNRGRACICRPFLWGKCCVLPRTPASYSRASSAIHRHRTSGSCLRCQAVAGGYSKLCARLHCVLIGCRPQYSSFGIFLNFSQHTIDIGSRPSMALIIAAICPYKKDGRYVVFTVFVHKRIVAAA